jgi:hypothetical protein
MDLCCSLLASAWNIPTVMEPPGSRCEEHVRSKIRRDDGRGSLEDGDHWNGTQEFEGICGDD